MGWLHPSDAVDLDACQSIADLVRSRGYDDVVVLGMGGSSLCPEVLSAIFERVSGFPRLSILDSTVPESVTGLATTLDPGRSLFLVSSKSGGTSETLAFKRYFQSWGFEKLGDEASRHFIAITDPESSLAQSAAEDGFQDTVLGLPSIGGRFSALSAFGMAPAAAMGLNVEGFLRHTDSMVEACTPVATRASGSNPAVDLGLWMGNLAKSGVDKLTLLIDEPLAPLGAWLEQLIAESTGKSGKGIIPVVDEPFASIDAYGSDRLFVRIRLDSHPTPALDELAEAIARRGLPIHRIALSSADALGQEFFRWEMATAVAASVLRINPFDQPDVEASKIETRKLSDAFSKGNPMEAAPPIATGAGMKLFADAQAAAQPHHSIEPLLSEFLGRIGGGDYFAIQAFVAQSPGNHRHLQSIRRMVLEHRRVATSLGYGPRFLHSTGQLHKGGPESGVFLQITADSDQRVEIPGSGMSFSDLVRFQAEGDRRVLEQRHRRVLRVHLEDAAMGLDELRETIASLL